jgi:SAM-dependent methyltransferase
LIREELKPARAALARSPFIKRVQTWPRGYPGDFETIEYLLAQRVNAAANTVEYWMEYYALSTPIAQQHRNKVEEQARQIASVLRASRAGKARILVLACGSAPDLGRVVDLIQKSDCTVVLNDADPGALAAATRRLAAVREKLALVEGNAFGKVKGLQDAGPFQMIVAGGLFDYLSDRQCEWLLRRCARMLAPGGRFFFTNVARPNPYLGWMEYLADWHLIARTEEDVRRLVRTGLGAAAPCEVSTDASGLALFISATRTEEERLSAPSVRVPSRTTQHRLAGHSPEWPL